MNHIRIRADSVLLLVALLWGSAFAAQRTAALEDAVFFFNAARFLVAAILLSPFAFRARLANGQVRWMLVAGAVLFIASTFQQAGLTSTTAANAGFLTSLYAVLVPLVMFVGWRERPGPLTFAALAVAAVGAYLLSTGGQFQARRGDLLELAGAGFWAMHVVLLGKYASRYDAIAFSAGQLFVASVLNWIVCGFLEPVVLPLSPGLIGAILFTAVVSLALGYTLQIWAQRHSPPTDAALIMSLEAVFAGWSGHLLLGERLNAVQLAGCAAIVFAVVLSQVRPWGRILSAGKTAG